MLRMKKLYICIVNKLKGGTAYRKIITLKQLKKGGSYGTA